MHQKFSLSVIDVWHFVMIFRVLNCAELAVILLSSFIWAMYQLQ